MNDIVFKPWGIQKDILKSKDRVIGAFAGKRGGKTEIGAIKAIVLQESQPNSVPDSIDPYLGVIMAPTHDMLKRLSWKKFNAYAKPFIESQTKSPLEIKWHDGSEILGISAERPERLEGVKANWIWIDEVFQVKEQLFLECIARTADTQGFIICTGSLGVQFINPKEHWAYKFFVENELENYNCFTWNSLDNPYFPEEELETLRETLDPTTFRQMFTIDWDTAPKNAVYDEFNEDNIIRGYVYQPGLETYVAIDWGWAHPMAALFFQYDRAKDTVYLFDEIISSKMKIDQLYDKILNKGYNITEWICDIAGNQEREQTGISNIAWFKERGIHFKHRRTAINYGIPIVRSYIKNSIGRRRFYADELRCPKSIDGVKRYRYNEKDGIILNENPVKENDDAVDALRYFYVNILDPRLRKKGSKIFAYA